MPDADELVARPADSSVALAYFAGQTVVPDLPVGISWIIRRNTGGYPRSLTEGTWVATDPALPFVDANLVNGVTYYYALFAVPLPGQTGTPTYGPSLGTFAQAMPAAGLPQVTAPGFLVAPTIEAVAPSSLLVSWTASEPAVAEITAESGDVLFTDGSFATQRSVAIDVTVPPVGDTLTVCLRNDPPVRGVTCSDPVAIPSLVGTDTLAPVFYEAPAVIESTEDRLVIRVVADEPVYVDVTLRSAAPYDRRLSRRAAPSREHLVELTGVTPGSAYRFSITAEDLAGNVRTAVESSFTTCTGCSAGSGSGGTALCDSRTASTEEAGMILESPRLTRATLRWGSTPGALDGRADLGLLARWRSALLPVPAPDTDVYYELVFLDRMGEASLAVAGSCRGAASAPAAELRIIEGPLADFGRVSSDQAIVSWTTDFIARGSVVDFGLAAADAELGPAASLPASAQKLAIPTPVGPLALAHEVALTNLAPNSRYFVVVRGLDLFGRSVDSEPLIFSTLEAGHTTPPAVTGGPTVVLATDDMTVVEWQTDRYAMGALDMQATGTRGAGHVPGRAGTSFQWASARAARNHRAVLAGVPRGTYAPSIQSRTADGYDLAAATDELDVDPPAEPDVVPPQISNVAAVPLSDGLALLRWTTSEPAESIVTYGTSVPLRSRIEDRSLVTGHLLQLTGLEPGKKILYQINASDVAGNAFVYGPGNVQLQPTKDETPPEIDRGSVSFRWVNDQTAVIEWDTDEPASSTVEYGGGMQYALMAQDGHHTEHHAITLTGFFPGKQYYARLLSIDAEGNKSNRYELTPFMAPVPATSPWTTVILAVILSSAAGGSLAGRRRGGRRGERRFRGVR